MDRPIILLINHDHGDACGVYQMGHRIAMILSTSDKYEVREVRCNNLYEMLEAAFHSGCQAVVVNYYESTMPWAAYLDRVALPVPAIGIAHEVTHADAFRPKPPFKHWIVCDPSFPWESPYYFRSVRPIWSPMTPFIPEKLANAPFVGTFGYALPGKGYFIVARAVKDEMPDAIFRCHMPPATFHGGFDGGAHARSIANFCASIDLACEVTTENWPDEELMLWLGQNDLNCLFYDPNPGRGVSGALDWLVAAGKPVAITRSEQFRHVLNGGDTGIYLCPWPELTLRGALLQNGRVVQRLQREWSQERFTSEWEAILDKVLENA